MTVETQLKAVLEADAPLLALASGGIWNFTETGAMGLSRTLTPSAFDSLGMIKPAILLAERYARPTGDIQDDDSQTMSVSAPMAIYFFQYGATDVLASMKSRVYQLLHAKRIAGLVRVEWDGDQMLGRDLALDCYIDLVTYRVVYIRAGA